MRRVKGSSIRRGNPSFTESASLLLPIDIITQTKNEIKPDTSKQITIFVSLVAGESLIVSSNNFKNPSTSYSEHLFYVSFAS